MRGKHVNSSADGRGGADPPAASATSDSWLDLQAFPIVPPDARPRALYFSRELMAIDTAGLQARGYEVVNVLALPRRTDPEHRVYLLAKAQGIEEGTIPAGEEDRFRLQLEMQAYGLMNNKSTRINLNVSVDAHDIKKMLDWGKDRHTLRDNTTIVGISELMLHDGIDKDLREKVQVVQERIETMRQQELADGEVSRGNRPGRRPRPDGPISRSKRGKALGG